jgi:hypothetical protein
MKRSGDAVRSNSGCGQVRRGGQRLTIFLARDITECKRGAEERERLRLLEADLAR